MEGTHRSDEACSDRGSKHLAHCVDESSQSTDSAGHKQSQGDGRIDVASCRTRALSEPANCRTVPSFARQHIQRAADATSSQLRHHLVDNYMLISFR